MNRILGLDPGLARCGWGLIVTTPGMRILSADYGLLTSAPTHAVPDRLWTIAQQFEALCDRLHPDVVAIEMLFFGKNHTTAMAIAAVRGVLLAHTAAFALPIIEVTPSAVKYAVTGSGTAPKGQVQRMVQQLLHLPQRPSPDDAADALAIAWTALPQVSQSSPRTKSKPLCTT
jgi:crossover junction endodeoxyribonuclease RuvC